MNCFARLITCGTQGSEKRQDDGGLNSVTQFVSEVTRTGESPVESHFVGTNSKGDTEVIISLQKNSGDKLGLKLFHNSLRVQSVEDDSVLAEFSDRISLGFSIVVVNGTVASVDNIKRLLRECRWLTDVTLTFSKPQAFTSGIKKAQSCSSDMASAPHSPSPSQLSTMWRRVSETGSLPVSSEGVVPIDFAKLSKDSMVMWTRNSSLPDPTIRQPDGECGESPTSWRARRRAKRSSCDGDYTII